MVFVLDYYAYISQNYDNDKNMHIKIKFYPFQIGLKNFYKIYFGWYTFLHEFIHFCSNPSLRLNDRVALPVIMNIGITS